MGRPDADLKVIQSITSIREELEAHGDKLLVGGMVELGADRADNAEGAEVKVDMSAVYK